MTPFLLALALYGCPNEIWLEDSSSVDGDADVDVDTDVDTGSMDADHDTWTIVEGDCDDGNRQVHPHAHEVCDGLDNDCDEVIPADEADADADGWMICEGDCEDGRANAYPGATEVVADGVDEDCDGIELCYQDIDADGDGHLKTTDTVASEDLDCADLGEAIYPGDDCDDSDASVGGPSRWYLDADGDGFGTPSSWVEVCTQPVGYVGDANDCYDDNIRAYPGETTYYHGDRGDGSWDYDCDGSETQVYPHPSGCHPGRGGCSDPSDGWSGSVPACGETGTYATGCHRLGPLLSGSGCGPDSTSSLTQSCK
jgi:hypothetical protein